MQSLGIIPSENIELCLGLFCYENFFFDKLRIEKFEKEFNLKFENIERLNIKEDLIIELKKTGNAQKIIHIPFESIRDYMRQACLACRDFTNIYADISFGGLGSMDKFTTVMTRTKKGMNIIRKVIDSGVVKSIRLDKTNKEKMKEKISQFCQSKIERFENFMQNKLILWKSSPLALEVDDK